MIDTMSDTSGALANGGVFHVLDVLDILSIWAGKAGGRMLYNELYGLDLDWIGSRLYLFSFVVLPFRLRIRVLIVNCGGMLSGGWSGAVGRAMMAGLEEIGRAHV